MKSAGRSRSAVRRRNLLYPAGGLIYLLDILFFIPGQSFAYMPRYVHVTLGIPWIAYLIFLLGVMAPVFLYLGVSWYWRHEIEGNKLGKDDKSEE
ncbi:MAG: hypothetical protein ACYCTV_00930 [Leptospirales bacterium]